MIVVNTAIPASLPVNPNLSEVVAFIFIFFGSTLHTSDIFFIIASLNLLIFGLSQIKVKSIFDIKKFSVCINFSAFFKKNSESAFFRFFSVGGNQIPISPLPNAPSNASVKECNPTSASECPINIL